MENKILCNIVLFEATKDNKSDYIIDHKVQHMHLVSKKEIKENDWYLYKHFGEWIPPCKFKGDDEINTKQNLNSKPRFFFKVEATTDKKLDLPLSLAICRQIYSTKKSKLKKSYFVPLNKKKS